MIFKQTFPTPAEHTKGKNTCDFIVLHHTGTKAGTIKGVLDGLYRRPDYASCHFVVDINGDIYKIGTPEDILWHAGVSKWGELKDMNNFSIGIELVGDGKIPFPNPQRKATKELIKHLMNVYKIPVENVLRHKDVAPNRKTDISDLFWNDEFKSFDDWKKAKLN